MPDYTIQQGATFRVMAIWAQPTFVVKPITGVTKSFRPVLTAPAHGIPAGVDLGVWIRGVAGMTKLNHDASDVGIDDKKYYATRIDDNTLTLHCDTLDFQSYTSGGELIYQPSVDLTGCSTRMHVRRRISDAVPLLTLSSSGVAPASRLTIGVYGQVGIEISATDTASMDWTSAVWDLEAVHPDTTVTRVLGGKISVSPEVTRE